MRSVISSSSRSSRLNNRRSPRFISRHLTLLSVSLMLCAAILAFSVSSLSRSASAKSSASKQKTSSAHKAGASSSSFAIAQQFATGASPQAVSAGDLNGDGLLDLVTANRSDSTVSVLINTAAPGANTPTFATKQDFATGAGPQFVTLGDVNGDGSLDLVVANGIDNTVSVLLNNAATGAVTPNFVAAQTFAVGANPTSVLLGDLNGDGSLDLAVTNADDNTVSVLLNTTAPASGTPTFATQQTFATGSSPQSLSIGDVSGDGALDLVTANGGDNNVSVLLNTTAPGGAVPSFAGAQNFAAGQTPSSITLGDLNGDGQIDLAVTNQADNNVSVLLNSTAPGAGTVSFARQDIAIGASPLGIALGDVNGDGRLDLAVTNLDTNTVSVALNTTAPGAVTPSFATQQDYATGAWPIAALLGDLNGDGKLDLIVANYDDNSVSVLLNDFDPDPATPGFTAAQDFATGASPSATTTGDVNGDGKLDLIVTNRDDNTVSVLLNTTAPGATIPSYTSQQIFAVGSGPAAIAVGDLNGDGRLDLVVANQVSNNVSVLLNTTAPGSATPNFALAKNFAVGTFPAGVALGDLSGDGRLDLVVTSQVDNNVEVLLNTTNPGAGVPNFATAQNFVVSTPQAVAVGDLNGDGRPDLAVTNLGSFTVVILINTSASGSAFTTFGLAQSFATGSSPVSLTLGDLNGDGRLDLAVANQGDGTASVLLNTTAPGADSSGFAPQQTFAAGASPSSIAVGDLNGDGKLDLAVANQSDNNVSVLGNTTAPGATVFSFATQQVFTTNAGPSSVTLGDINGDGKLDINVADTSSNTVSVLLNTPTIVAATGLSRQQGTAASNSQIATVTDYGGDGNVIVTVTSANPDHGVTISNIVNAGGNITADIVADCAGANATFTLQASDGSSTVTDTLTVNVTAIPTPTITPSGPTTFCAGGSVTLTSDSATGNQWSLNGTAIGGETNQTFVATAAGDYTVTVTAGSCTSTPSLPTTVTVNPIPATPTITPGGSTTSCTGGRSLRSSSVGGNQWYLNSNPIAGETNDTYLAIVAGDYTVTVTTSGCTSAPSAATTVSMTIGAAPVVTTNADSGAGSLRQAILDACPGSTITFDMEQVVSPITLTSAELVIDKELTIQGPGATLLTIQRSTANGTPEFRIFDVTTEPPTLAAPASINSPTPMTTTLAGLTISNGSVTEGPLKSDSARGRLSPSSLPNNVGGGIFNAGEATVNVTDSIVTGNTAPNGGGIASTGAGTLNLINSTVSGNTALSVGGAILSVRGTVTVTSSVLNSNSAVDAGGGMFAIFTIVTITNSTVNANTTDGDGGGIYAAIGTVNVIGSTVSGNTAKGVSGGAGRNVETNFGISAKLSQLTGGPVGTAGGIYSGGILNLVSSTISGNAATSATNTDGGGLFVASAGATTIVNSTIANNSAVGPNSASGIFISSGAVIVGNSIIAANVNNGMMPDVIGTTFNSQGHNIIGNPDAVTAFNQTGDQTGTSATPLDPKLVVDGLGIPLLQNNGGPTLTHALRIGSPALDAGAASENPIDCQPIVVDQRGLSLPVDLNDALYPNATDGSDIGAFEARVSEANSAPSITAAAPLSRQQSTTAVNGQIATVSDPDQAANTLVVTVTPLTGSGVTISNISVDGAGNVTADVVASCTATDSTLTLTVTDSSNATATATLTVNVTVPATPTITPGGPTTFCNGGSVTLTSSSASGNQWYLNGNQVDGATNQTYSATASANYTVTDASSGCPSAPSAATTVTVNPIPATPTITPGGPTTFCTGGSVTLTSSSATGNQWYLNGNPIGGATNQAYSATASGNYTVTDTATGCTSAPSSATAVTVNPIPATPTITPDGPTTFCTGGSVSLTSSSATGNQWYLNGNPIAGATNQAYSATAAGNYTSIVTTTGCSSLASAATTVTINPIPSTPTITPAEPASLCAGGNVALNSSSATGNQWYLNGNPIGGATAQQYLATTAGNYSVTVTTSGCSSTSSTTTNVAANVAPTLTYATPQSVAFAGDMTVNTTSSSGAMNGYTVLSVVPAMTTAPTVDASGSVSITNAQAGGAHTITIRATDSCGITVDASFTLNVSVTTTYSDPAGNCGGNTPCYTGIQSAIDGLTSNGTVNVSGGTFNEDVNLSGNVTLNINGNTTINSLTISAGTLNSSNGGSFVLTLATGNWTNDGGTFNQGTGTVSFTGTGQTIGGTNPTIFNNLTIGSGGTTVNSTRASGDHLLSTNGPASAAVDVAVNGVLTLNGDLTITAPARLIMPGSASSMGTGDVIGNVERSGFVSSACANAPCANTLSFGNPDNQLTITSGTAPTSVLVNLAKTAPATYTAAVQRNYTITETGGGFIIATLRLHYLDAELNGNTPESNLNLRRFNGTDWVAVNRSSPVDTDNNWVEADAVTSFSQWTFAVLAPTATSGSISGRILSDNGTPVEGAVVRLSGGQTRKLITNKDGNYQFDNVATGEFYTVTPSRANFSFNPFNRSFSQVGNQIEAAFTGASLGDTANPLDTPEYFVRQQYVDVLGREPDEAGFNYWSDQLLACGEDANCTRTKRTDVAAAFFIENEAQQTGSYIYDVYAGSLGRRPAFGEYASDRQQVVGGATLDAAKTAFARSFVQRSEFTTKYHDAITAESFVDALLLTTQGSGNLAMDRDSLIGLYGQSGDLITSRAAVIRSLADNAAFKQSQYNQAFVLTEYFAYLKRDIDQNGYDFWVNVLNSSDAGNYRGMVCSFITSTEYQKRFSQIASHSNAECGP